MPTFKKGEISQITSTYKKKQTKPKTRRTEIKIRTEIKQNKE
jgi:hypothetical protein